MNYTVVDNQDESRYEIFDGDLQVGRVQYRRAPHQISFMHTETDPVAQGRGFASVLIERVLTEARTAGVAVLPFCPFVRRFIANNDEYLDLVPGDRRGAFGLE